MPKVTYQALDEVPGRRAAGIRAEVSHPQALRPNAWGQAGQVLARLEQARAEGLDITQDQYVYTASSTGLSQLLPAWALEVGRDEFRQRVADPALKARLIADRKRRLREQKRTTSPTPSSPPARTTARSKGSTSPRPPGPTRLRRAR